MEWLNEIDIQYIETQQQYGIRHTNFDELARKEEIFLDLLSFECSKYDATKYLMRERYVDALSDEEKEMKRFVNQMIDDMIR